MYKQKNFKKKLFLLTMLRRKIKVLIFFKKFYVAIEHFLLFLIFNIKRIKGQKDIQKLG